MVLDCLIILILALFAIAGFKKGFLFAFIHSLGWIAALAGAFFCYNTATDLISKHTGIYDWILSGFSERFSSGDLDLKDSFSLLPDGFSIDAGDAANAATSAVARMFSELTFTVIVFVGLFILIKIIVWLLLKRLSKGHEEGFAGFFDGLLGMTVNLIKGAILIYLLLAAFVPLADLLAPDIASAFATQLDQSSIAKELYDKNLLLILADKLTAFFS